jgi:hypothetical protein
MLAVLVTEELFKSAQGEYKELWYKFRAVWNFRASESVPLPARVNVATSGNQPGETGQVR